MNLENVTCYIETALLLSPELTKCKNYAPHVVSRLAIPLSSLQDICWQPQIISEYHFI